jgi:hypothetical protein
LAIVTKSSQRDETGACPSYQYRPGTTDRDAGMLPSRDVYRSIPPAAGRVEPTIKYVQIGLLRLPDQQLRFDVAAGRPDGVQVS